MSTQAKQLLFHQYRDHDNQLLAVALAAADNPESIVLTQAVIDLLNENQLRVIVTDDMVVFIDKKDGQPIHGQVLDSAMATAIGVIRAQELSTVVWKKGARPVIALVDRAMQERFYQLHKKNRDLFP